MPMLNGYGPDSLAHHLHSFLFHGEIGYFDLNATDAITQLIPRTWILSRIFEFFSFKGNLVYLWLGSIILLVYFLHKAWKKLILNLFFAIGSSYVVCELFMKGFFHRNTPDCHVRTPATSRTHYLRPARPTTMPG